MAGATIAKPDYSSYKLVVAMVSANRLREMVEKLVKLTQRFTLERLDCQPEVWNILPGSNR